MWSLFLMQCNVSYDSSVEDIYQVIRAYPLMSTPAPNCELGQPCDDYKRVSDDALAVFEGIRGQQLAVINDTDTDLTVYIGTSKLYFVALIAKSFYISGFFSIFLHLLKKEMMGMHQC